MIEIFLKNTTYALDPNIVKLKTYITETLHKKLENVRDLCFERDLIDIGPDMHNPDPEYHRWKHFTPGPITVRIYFDGDDQPYLYDKYLEEA